MNVKRFTARSPREALQLVRQAFGDDAVVLSTRPCPEGVEMLAMPHETVRQLETFTPGVPARPLAATDSAPAPVQPQPQPQAPQAQAQPDQADAAPMSTLSFQDYVRERMLKRRRAELREERSEPRLGLSPAEPMAPAFAPESMFPGEDRFPADEPAAMPRSTPVAPMAPAPAVQQPAPVAAQTPRLAAVRPLPQRAPRHEPPVLRD